MLNGSVWHCIYWKNYERHRKNPKNSDIETFAVITLKFEQLGFTIE